MPVLLEWINRVQADGIRVYRDTSPIDISDLPTPIATLAADVAQYLDEDASDAVYYAVSAYKGAVEKFAFVSATAAEAAPFVPESMFASGEKGVMFDFSDLSTLFQDRAGGIPVTAAGNPVGLVLDKSQGLALGSELLTNGTFDSNITGWETYIAARGTVSWSSGTLLVDNSAGTGNAYAATQFASSPVAGTYIKVTADFTNTTQDAIFYPIDAAKNVLSTAYVVPLSSGSATATILVPSGTTGLLVGNQDTTTNWNLDNVTVKHIAGNHATQATAAKRPTYNTDGTYHWLEPDGIDDFMVTNTIIPATNKAQVFVGLSKVSDAAEAVVLEHSANSSSNAGSLDLFAPVGAAPITHTYRSLSRGSAAATGAQSATTTTPVGAAPDTAVITATHDVPADLSRIRRNGAYGADGTSEKGTGNFLNHPMYLGCRGGGNFFFDGRIYFIAVRFGPNLDDLTIAKMEDYINSKTGAY